MFFQKAFKINSAGKTLQLSANREHLQAYSQGSRVLPGQVLRKSHPHLLAVFIVTQHLTSTPSQIKEISFTSLSLLLPFLIVSRAFNHFQSMHSDCAYEHVVVS